ncbi:MAG TPA: adenine phosphoribosyltransferase [bacterium]|nr:adenine phosphoribosyltransferase [bacterium]HNT66060.1 adenine phosphoribosyltransferase [bacterium]HOX85507.1 adenine phosphoribosyltransferase [bacterium]HPG44666.1 adenine phosphoribosyltransferase [bacterium]HPM99427.1 adenine phosphoribosyltransferase [bacterium]
MTNLSSLIRNVPDFPKPGIQFKDITTLIQDARGFHQAIDQMVAVYAGEKINCLVGVEARGFIFASAMAWQMGVGMALVRKPGKLPAATLSESFSLEYGQDALEIHSDALAANSKVVIVDDLLATGGTMLAAVRLVERLQAKVVGCSFLIELDRLGGRQVLQGYRVESLLHYFDSE